MSAEPIYPVADKAAREVDPMILAHALDHIAKTAAKTRTSTRRLRWIERRAVTALKGLEYRDIDFDLPKGSADTTEKKSRRIAFLLSCLHKIKESGVSKDVLSIVEHALQPTPRLNQGNTMSSDARALALQWAVEGECNGLAITKKQASAILDYVDSQPSGDSGQLPQAERSSELSDDQLHSLFMEAGGNCDGDVWMIEMSAGTPYLRSIIAADRKLRAQKP